MYQIMTIASILFTVFTSSAFAQTATPGNLGISTPEPLTTKWASERDLTILFENADDRISLAQLIISECISDSSMNTEKRIDGLRIAGHICYRDNATGLATSAFTTLNQITTEPRWRSEATRMLAQLSMDQGDLVATTALLKDAWEFAALDDPTGSFLSTKSILNLICSLSSATGNHEEALNYAIIGTTLFEHQSTQRELAQFIYWAYIANKELGDFQAASLYVNELIENHPGFQSSNNTLGIPPLLIVDSFELQGRGWSDPSEEFVQAALDICYNPNYLYMPSRLIILKKLGHLLEDHDQTQAAIEIRSNLRNDLSAILDSSPPIETVLLESLRVSLARLALDDAKASLELGDYQSAIETLTEISASSETLPIDITDHTTALLESAVELMPAP